MNGRPWFHTKPSTFWKPWSGLLIFCHTNVFSSVEYDEMHNSGLPDTGLEWRHVQIKTANENESTRSVSHSRFSLLLGQPSATHKIALCTNPVNDSLTKRGRSRFEGTWKDRRDAIASRVLCVSIWETHPMNRNVWTWKPIVKLLMKALESVLLSVHSLPTFPHPETESAQETWKQTLYWISSVLLKALSQIHRLRISQEILLLWPGKEAGSETESTKHKH